MVSHLFTNVKKGNCSITLQQNETLLNILCVEKKLEISISDTRVEKCQYQVTKYKTEQHQLLNAPYTKLLLKNF